MNYTTVIAVVVRALALMSDVSPAPISEKEENIVQNAQRIQLDVLVAMDVSA